MSPTLSAATIAKFGTGNEFDIGNERHDVMLMKRLGVASLAEKRGVYSYHINGSTAYDAGDDIAAPGFFEEECDASSTASGYCFSIGSRGPRVINNREMPARLRDFQLYITYKPVPDDILTAADSLSAFETLTREDWD